MTLLVEYQVALRRLYDMGLNKAETARRLNIAEPTVYRYFAKWDALKQTQNNPYVVNIADMFSKKMLTEIEIQATMRRMSVQGYVSAIIATVISDNLSASILDISETHPSKKRLSNGTE